MIGLICKCVSVCMRNVWGMKMKALPDWLTKFSPEKKIHFNFTAFDMRNLVHFFPLSRFDSTYTFEGFFESRNVRLYQLQMADIRFLGNFSFYFFFVVVSSSSPLSRASSSNASTISELTSHVLLHQYTYECILRVRCMCGWVCWDVFDVNTY